MYALTRCPASTSAVWGGDLVAGKNLTMNFIRFQILIISVLAYGEINTAQGIFVPRKMCL